MAPRCPFIQIVLSTRVVALLLSLPLAPACNPDEVPPLPVVPPERAIYSDGGPSSDAGSSEPADAGCGLSFDEAVSSNPGERVCQTTVYDRVTGYCTHWVPCSSL
jgi:hypothetical protein